MAKNKLSGVSDDTLAVLDTPYQQSDTVKALGQEASDAYDALKTAGSANNAAAQRALNQWKGYGDFTYNPDTDVLYQNARSNAIANGKIAMQDTIGGASALTGGYANSYAASAGSQAYQSYLQSLDDDLATYYQLALDQHTRGKNDLLTEYSIENERGQQAWDRAYGLYGVADSRYSTERGFDYGQYSDRYNAALQMAGMQNADYWNQTNFDEGVRRDERNFAYQKTRDKVADEQWDKNYLLNEKATKSDIEYKQGMLGLNREEFQYKKDQAEIQAQAQAIAADSDSKLSVSDALKLTNDLEGLKYPKFGEPNNDAIYEKIMTYYDTTDLSEKMIYELLKRYVDANYLINKDSELYKALYPD